MRGWRPAQHGAACRESRSRIQARILIWRTLRPAGNTRDFDRRSGSLESPTSAGIYWHQIKRPESMDILNRRDVLRLAAAAATASTAHASDDLPTVRFGVHEISRLIVGGNPVSVNSHVSPQLDAEMRDYFTTANVKKLLADCERAGINTWQSRGDRHIMRLLDEYREEGGRIQWRSEERRGGKAQRS